MKYMSVEEELGEIEFAIAILERKPHCNLRVETKAGPDGKYRQAANMFNFPSDRVRSMLEDYSKQVRER